MKPAVYPELAPFRALRYQPDRAGCDISRLVCPPYDVIDRQQHQQLAEGSPYNAVHLILPKLEERFNFAEGTYSYKTQSSLMTKMRSDGVLVRDKEPALYVYHQIFPNPYDPLKSMTRRGFIALKRLADFSSGKIRPHEKTLSGPKADRLNVMRALRANMSPIFGLYTDPSRFVDEMLTQATAGFTPDFEFQTAQPETITHRLWVVDEPQRVAEACKKMHGLIFIADGHHRYETALTYAKELDEQHADLPPDGAHHYMPIYLANMDDPGMLILPTHRMVHSLANMKQEFFLNSLKQRFEIELLALSKSPSIAEIERLLPLSGPMAYILQLSPILAFKITVPKNVAGNDLDLVVLHREILEKELGIDQKAQEEQTHLRYTRDPEEAARELGEEKVQAVFYTRPPTAAQLRQCCEEGLRMPQKSTYFFPKVLTGLIFRPIDPHEHIHL